MRADKLKPGDELRIISPSRSLSLIDAQQRKIAKEQLERLGFRISISTNSLRRMILFPLLLIRELRICTKPF